MAALVFRETLLPAVAQPGLPHDARARGFGERDGAVRRPRIDDHDLIGDSARGAHHVSDHPRLVPRAYEGRKGRS